jgi:hypothetical protein
LQAGGGGDAGFADAPFAAEEQYAHDFILAGGWNLPPYRLRKYPEFGAGEPDKRFVSRFVDNAAQILDAAENGVRSGHTPSDMTILITQEGGIRMVADSDWPLDSLQAEYGAKMAYRVSQDAAVVRVEGRAGSRTCLFETEKPERAARLLLGHTCGYGAPSYSAVPRLLPSSQAGIA